MSSLYFDVVTSVQNSGLVQTNGDGTDKCPLFWELEEQATISDRYNSNLGEKSMILGFGETINIPISSGVYKSNIKPILTINFYASGTTGNTQNFYLRFNGDFVSYELLLNIKGVYEIEIPENAEKIEILNVNNNYLHVFEDYKISFKTTPITNFRAEFTEFSIDPKLVNSKVLSNKIRQRKIGKTEVQYTFDPVITSDQNAEIDDIRDFARLNKLLTLVYINYSETNGDTLADFPQESGYIKYFYITHSTTQKTGLYEYINLTVANRPNISIR